MRVYGEIKKTTWRGAKVRKVIKFLKSYQYIVGKPHFPIDDMSDVSFNNKTKMEIHYYGIYIATDAVLRYIEKVFESDQYTKKEFKKKIFSGSKVVSVLEYLDITISNARKNYDLLQNDNLLTMNENKETFITFWESQLETYLKIKKWILFGLTQKEQILKEEEDWIGNIIYELEDDDD